MPNTSGPRLLWLPDAVRDSHGRSLSFTTAANPKGVLHTTEGLDWPGYNGWTILPQVTVKPIPRVGVKVRQHIDFDHAGFALDNDPGGVETNKARAYQVELVGTCERGGRVHRAGGFLWQDADDAVLLDLHDKVLEPMTALGIPLDALDFQAYPASYGPNTGRPGQNKVRLSGRQWEAFTGWCGHQHVPENDHGDPGNFPWSRMMLAVERRRAEREDPFMALSDADAKKIGDAVADALVQQLPRAIVADLLAWDTIPDLRARAAGVDPATPDANVSLRSLLAHAFESFRQDGQPVKKP